MGTQVKKQPFLTKHLGFRVSETVFTEIQQRAAAAGRSANDWCRERLVSTLDGLSPSTSDYALLAEVAATQAIMIDLIYTWAHDGKLSQKAVQDIVHAAQNSKFKEASQLFSAAHARGKTRGNHLSHES